MSSQELLEKAREASTNAVAPFSGLRVGAALLAASGRVYAGANFESKTLGLTVCAERVALWCALASGEREFVAMALTAFKGEEEVKGITPCGACRQLLWEFAPNLRVILNDGRELPIKELLPEPFGGP